METVLETLEPTRSLDDVLKILDRGHVALIVEGTKFHGLITRIDLLNSLRRKLT
jgi:cystathionine beta-synthase